MDPETVDQNYAQLQQQGQQTTALIQALAGKLQAAAAAGDSNAREWVLDLREITLGVQQEEGQMSLLRWMVGFNLAATVGLIFLFLRH